MKGNVRFFMAAAVALFSIFTAQASLLITATQTTPAIPGCKAQVEVSITNQTSTTINDLAFAATLGTSFGTFTTVCDDEFAFFDGISISSTSTSSVVTG